MISKKLLSEITQILDPDQTMMEQKRIMWQIAAEKRKQFLLKIREEGLKGKDYSKTVVEYDKENRVVFYV